MTSVIHLQVKEIRELREGMVLKGWQVTCYYWVMKSTGELGEAWDATGAVGCSLEGAGESALLCF